MKNNWKKIGLGLLALGAVGGVGEEIIDPYQDQPEAYVITAQAVDGETKIELAKDSPDITLSKQNGVVAWNLTYPIDVVADKLLLSDKVEYGNITVTPLKADVGQEDGGIMLEIVAEDPTPISFDVSGITDFRWLYQDAGNREKDDIYPELAPEQQGSYAVYNPVGEKLFHVYRPIVTDAGGDVTYGKLSFEIHGQKKTFSIIPSASVKYPVIIRTSFAMTTIPLTNEIYHE